MNGVGTKKHHGRCPVLRSGGHGAAEPLHRAFNSLRPDKG
jgi:hypothetical protein